MIQLSDNKIPDTDTLEIRAAFTLIEPTAEVVAVLDEHLPGWSHDESVAWTAGNVRQVTRLDMVQADQVDEYLRYEWQTLLRELGNGVIDKSVQDWTKAQAVGETVMELENTEDTDVEDQ